MKEKILFLVKINSLHIFIICLHDFINTLAVFHIFFYLLVYFVHKHKERERVKTRSLSWLDYQDSNLDKQNQNLLCYHYTIVQSSCAFLEKRCKGRAFSHSLQIISNIFLIFAFFFYL